MSPRGDGLLARIFDERIAGFSVEELRSAQKLLRQRLTFLKGPAVKGTKKKLYEVEKALRRFDDEKAGATD